LEAAKGVPKGVESAHQPTAVFVNGLLVLGGQREVVEIAEEEPSETDAGERGSSVSS